MNWNEKEILITGGTGSLGKTLTNLLLEKYSPKGIRIYSRDELKQYEMKKSVVGKQVAFLIGDVRDRKRLELACKGVDIIIHAAAMKHVIFGEDNPIETIQTNVVGSQNIIYAALENNVEKVMGISSDKACYPINLYGATKLCMERLFIEGNSYSGGRNPRFSICRYGNVIGSRGSVIPLFKKQLKTGILTITEPHATRFWITLERVAQFICDRVETMEGEEIFIPTMPSCTILQIAQAIAEKNTKYRKIGLSLGEKMDEVLITKEESKRTQGFILEKEPMGFFVITKKYLSDYGTQYDSLSNESKLTKEEIQKFI